MSVSAYAVRRRLHVAFAPGQQLEQVLREQAQGGSDELLRTFPDFRSRGPEKMKAELCPDEHVAQLLDGLRKAGLGMRHVRAGR